MDDRRQSAAAATAARRVCRRVASRLRRWDATPRQLTVVYLAIGLLALYASDVLFVRTLSDPALRRVQAAKGAVEVFATAGLVYWLTRRSRSALARTNATLDRRNEELQVLHRVLRHNLRNDLNVIQGRAADLEEHVTSPTGDQHLEAIAARADALAGYTDQAHRIRRLTEERSLTSFDLAATLDALLADHPSIDDEVTVVRHGFDGPDVTVRAHPLLPIALAELVRNGIEHSDAASVRLDVTIDRETGRPETTAVGIADDGPGIPAVARGVLEDGSEDQLTHCTGLGLWFVRWAVTHSSGEIDVDADECGTSVRILLHTAVAPESRVERTRDAQ